MSAYSKYKPYFQNLGESTEGINSVVFLSNWEEIIELQLNNAEYPALIIETPDLELKDQGGNNITFESAFAVISGIAKDSTRQETQTLLDEMAELSIEVWTKLQCDIDVENKLDGELDTTLNPVIKATADNCYGWRGYFKISNID